MAHSYIVGFARIDTIECILPAAIAIPWYQISASIGLKPVVCYGSLELYNFKLLNSELPPSLENMAILHTFSGSFDESWFYLIPLAIESTGAGAIRALLDSLDDLERGKVHNISGNLDLMKNKIESMTRILRKMYDRNDPHIFWNRVRPYSGIYSFLKVRRVQEFCSIAQWVVL